MVALLFISAIIPRISSVLTFSYELLTVENSKTPRMNLPVMIQPKKRLTGEEISRAREKNQKKRDKKRDAGFITKEGASSAQLRITTEGNKQMGDVVVMDESPKGGWVRAMPDETLNCIGPNGEWITVEDPPHWNKEELNVDWPWERVPSKLLTQAPFAVNEHNFDAGFFKLPQEVQVCNLGN